ncbi:MAG: hypothetical protein WDN27_03185 [Candidatus Saccharibacteria bacterium]
MTFQPQLKKIADFGSGEEWIARTEMTMLDFLPFLRVDKSAEDVKANGTLKEAFDEKKEAATGLAMAIAEELGQAFIDLRRLRETKGVMPTEIEVSKAYRDLYGHLWAAYKGRFQDFMKLLEYNIHFIFDKDSKFDSLAANFTVAHPNVNGELIERVRSDRATWHEALHTYRDDGEHNVKKPLFTGHPMHSLHTAEVIFSNTWHAIEDVFIHCMEEELGEQLTIFEIPKERRDTMVPKKYAVGLRVDTATNQVLSRT